MMFFSDALFQSTTRRRTRCRNAGLLVSPVDFGGLKGPTIEPIARQRGPWRRQSLYGAQVARQRAPPLPHWNFYGQAHLWDSPHPVLGRFQILPFLVFLFFRCFLFLFSLFVFCSCFRFFFLFFLFYSDFLNLR